MHSASFVENNRFAILPEHLIAVLIKNDINPDSDVLDDVIKLGKDRPEKYRAMLSGINDATYNGIFYYSECLHEAIFNLMFCGIICWNSTGKYTFVTEELLDTYLMRSLSEYDETIKTILDEFIKDLKRGFTHV